MIAYFNEATDFTVEQISTVSFPLQFSCNFIIAISGAKRSIIFINSALEFRDTENARNVRCIICCILLMHVAQEYLRSMTSFHLVR